jgi:hypothetical protein
MDRWNNMAQVMAYGDECPPTLRCPDSTEVMEERQRQALLDLIMAECDANRVN